MLHSWQYIIPTNLIKPFLHMCVQLYMKGDPHSCPASSLTQFKSIPKIWSKNSAHKSLQQLDLVFFNTLVVLINVSVRLFLQKNKFPEYK